MAILAGDIKLVESQVMDDVPEGGGAPTANIILDGESNNIFPDISEVDRAGGRINMRKVHVHVQSDNRDTYLGGNVIVAEPPDDPNVSITLFSTRETFDRRTDASDRVESYLIKGPTWPGYLYENHIVGQRAIQIFQRTETELPPIGRTLVLVQNEGLSNEREQYVRVTRVSYETRTFFDAAAGSDYRAAIVTCDISDALRFDFTGTPALRTFTRAANAAMLRDTNVADAGTYAGVVALTEEAAIGDLTAKVDGVYTQLVPNAQTEIALTDLRPNGELLMFTPSGDPYSVTTSAAFDTSNGLFVGQNVMPGSLTITVAGISLTDSGGRLMSGVTQVGLVDYDQGIITLLGSGTSYSGVKTLTYTPAAAPPRFLSTASWIITQEARSSTFVQIIDPPPAPTTVQISYRAQGRWYNLRDNGTGQLVGSDAAYGSGTINYATGSLVVTLGALPDVNSNVLMTYGSVATEDDRSGGATKLGYDIQLANGGVAPNSVSIEWGQGLVTKTATDDGVGNLEGDATGEVDYLTGRIRILPNNIPGANPEFSVQYSWGAPVVESFLAPEREADGSLLIELANPNVLPGTMQVEWNTVFNPEDLLVSGSIYETFTYTSEVTSTRPWAPTVDPIVRVKDNGVGSFKTRPETGAVIDYTLGTIQFKPDTEISLPTPLYNPQLIGTSVYDTSTGERVDVGAGVIETVTTTITKNTFQLVYDGFEYITIGAVFPSDLSGTVTVRYRTTAAGTTATEVFTPSATLDLTPGFRDPIVGGSLSFTVGGRRYFDRQGSLFTDLNLSNGSATSAGSVNYSLGTVTLTLVNEGAANSGVVQSMSTTQAILQVPELRFRTSAAPIRPGGFTVQFVLSRDGTQTTRTLTADTNGKITATDVKGEIDYETGVVSLRFGEMVTAAGNEGKVWYNPAYVSSDGKIWRPYTAISDSVRYAAVAFTYLPLDASLLGLDPVRLPQDGRVPIFRTGGFAVIGNTASMAPATVTNGQTLDTARTRLSRVRVVGNDGLTINNGYTTNLEAGTVTFTDVTGYAQPVTVEHRIEDLVQISDVQISGLLGFTRRLTHDYPVTGTYVSSALMSGDLRSRVSTLFDQGSWDGISWGDTVVGSPATGTYNDILAPILVTNVGAITERWALRFTTTTAFQVIGEHVGVIATGSTNATCAPLNPATGEPYFTISDLGWGTGWSVGNILRLNTVGAQFPVWVVRTVQQGPEAGTNYSFSLLTRGDVDRP